MNFLKNLFGKKDSKEIESQSRNSNNEKSFSKDFSILENAYLGRGDDERDKKIDCALDKITLIGDLGIKFLMEKLFKDFSIQNSRLSVKSYGELDHSEWIKRRMIVNALGRAKAIKILPKLIEIVDINCNINQYYSILQPSLIKALGEIGSSQSLNCLKALLKSSTISNDNTTIIQNILLEHASNNEQDIASIIDINQRTKVGKLGAFGFTIKKDVSKSSFIESIKLENTLTDNYTNKIPKIIDMISENCELEQPFVYDFAFKEVETKIKGDFYILVDYEDKWDTFAAKMAAQNYRGNFELMKALVNISKTLELTVQFYTNDHNVLFTI